MLLLTSSLSIKIKAYVFLNFFLQTAFLALTSASQTHVSNCLLVFPPLRSHPVMQKKIVFAKCNHSLPPQNLIFLLHSPFQQMPPSQEPEIHSIFFHLLQQSNRSNFQDYSDCSSLYPCCPLLFLFRPSAYHL